MPNENDDQTETSSASTDETNDGSSTVDKGGSPTDEKVLSFADIARKAYEESSARNEPKGEEDAPKTEEHAQDLGKSGDEGEDKGEKQQEEQPEVPAEEQEDEDDKEDDEKSLPFDKHPAWIKRTEKYNEQVAKATELESKLKAIEPELERWEYHNKFIKENGIPQQEVDQMMNWLAMVRSNPQQARKLLKPIWDQLSEVDDETMSPELIAAVKAGDMTEEYAQRLWKAETQSKAGKVSGQFQAQLQARRHQEARDQAIGSWDLAKRKADPDFKPKGPNAKDGLWEIVAKGWVYLKTMNPPATPQDEVRLLEQAYTEAKEFVTPLRPPVTRKKPVLTSLRSSGALKGTPKTLDDVVKGVAAGHGIAWSGRSNGSE